MVFGALFDTLVSPPSALKDLFAKAVAEGKMNDFPVFIRDHFSALFAGEALDQVPVLDVARPPDSYTPMSLVRFRAMVQDTSCSPEMYISSLTDSRCGGWGLDTTEELPEDLDLRSGYNMLEERDVIWAVSIPGEGHWCEPSSTPSGSLAVSPGTPVISTSNRNHKFPIPNSPYVAAQLKLYDSSAETLKPTSVHEFIGILTSESTHSDFATEEPVPTIHVLFHRKLPKTISARSLTELEASAVQMVRDELVDWMATEALGGDKDAAEWVLLCCLSSVESRNPPLFPIPITLSKFAKPAGGEVPSISLLLSEVLPLHFLLPISLQVLNEHNFLPESKNEDLYCGVLQVPNDTTIVITESGMAEGRLGEKGLENLKALQEVAKLQTLQYKFPFSQYSFPTDIKFINLTDGKKSLFLDSSINIPLRPGASMNLYNGRDSIKWPSPEMLSSFRDFIVRAKTAKVTVGEELSEYIKNDFVRERKEKATTTPDDLTRWMSLARLVSLSRLENQMSIDSWNTAKALDERRKARLS